MPGQHLATATDEEGLPVEIVGIHAAAEAAPALVADIGIHRQAAQAHHQGRAAPTGNIGELGTQGLGEIVLKRPGAGSVPLGEEGSDIDANAGQPFAPEARQTLGRSRGGEGEKAEKASRPGPAQQAAHDDAQAPYWTATTS